MEGNLVSVICKPSKWFIWRAVAMSAMLLGFGGFFYYDGAYGYKKQNVDFYQYAAKSEVYRALELAEIERSNNVAAAERVSPAHSLEDWSAYVAEHEVSLFEEKDNDKSSVVTDVEGCFPEGYKFPQKIPQVFVEKYEQLKQSKEALNTIWSEYAAAEGINESAGKYFRSRSVINEQYYWAIGSCLLGCVALFFLLRTLMRKMSLTSEGFKPAGGKLIPLEDILRIDKRKWARKGLAYIYYVEGESEKRVRLDGMVYGQFDEKNPHNAENLMQKLEASVVDVEVIDYEGDEDSDSKDSEGLEG